MESQAVQGVDGFYPSPNSYNLIFLTVGLLSVISIGFAFILRRGKEKIDVVLEEEK
jgi:hypothetical protein